MGKIKNYNHEKGFGFIVCEALNLQVPSFRQRHREQNEDDRARQLHKGQLSCSGCRSTTLFGEEKDRSTI